MLKMKAIWGIMSHVYNITHKVTINNDEMFSTLRSGGKISVMFTPDRFL